MDSCAQLCTPGIPKVAREGTLCMKENKIHTEHACAMLDEVNRQSAALDYFSIMKS